MKETTSVGSRTPGPQGPDQYGAKVFLETGGLGGGKGSLGHTGGLSTVTTGRFNFDQVLPALPSRARQTCARRRPPCFLNLNRLWSFSVRNGVKATSPARGRHAVLRGYRPGRDAGPGGRGHEPARRVERRDGLRGQLCQGQSDKR